MLVNLRSIVVTTVAFVALSSMHSLFAQQVIIPSPPQIAAKAYLLIDVNTGKVLVEENADQQLAPASLTKMMTSYIVSEEIEAGRLKEQDIVTVSEDAWRRGGSASGSSTMFLEPKTKVSVIDLLRGVIVQSGNDASIALAQHIAGSEGAFADIMNQQAALLGMSQTHYVNATGWPADGHLTTARDLALLSKALINDHPEHYSIYSEKYFSYNGYNQANRNKLLFSDDSVDGIKTGHTNDAGYCLVSSAQRNGMRLVAVVLGARSEASRATESQKLLSYGFRYYQTHQLYTNADALSTQRIWGGKADEINLGVDDNLYLTIPRGAQDKLNATMHIDETIKAPVKKGQELGRLVVELEGTQMLDVSLVAMEEVEQAGFLARIWDSIKLFFLGLFGLL